MLLSLALIFLIGMGLGRLFDQFRLPKLLGMMVTGMILGPFSLSLLDSNILAISAELRQIALIIILARAGLSLDIKDLKKVGRPAVLLCFLPACFEIAGMLLLAPKILGITLIEAGLLGAVVAAVSPAVVVPRMLSIMERGYGKINSVPQMVMAGSSVDDIFVIVIFTACLGLAQGDKVTPLRLVYIPTSIAFGLLAGVIIGLILSEIFTRFTVKDMGKVLIILSLAFLLVSVEKLFTGIIGFSGLLAVMAMGATIKAKKYEEAARLSGKFSRMWEGAELLLFVLLGATVNIQYAAKAGPMVALLVLAVLCFRIVGVIVSVSGTTLNIKERLFTAIAYIPKATVQAAIGGIPLAMGLACGEVILTVAVMSILITAPLGAILIDRTYSKLLQQGNTSMKKGD